jgi:prepilin signal peptidase PulO-like enzyme (type II secretory pathway)
MDIVLVFTIFALVFGLIIGSFLNVVIYRLNTGKSMGGRSMCMSCGTTLSWSELVPIVSYIAQGGKCRTCKSRFSSQYFWVELITGIMFALIAYKLAISAFSIDYLLLLQILFFFSIFAIFIAISVYDINHKIIPNYLVYILIILTFFSPIFYQGVPVDNFSLVSIGRLFDILAVTSPLLFFFAISRGQWMGFGDVKLALAIGLLLPISQGIATFLLSFWIGSIYAIFLLLLKSRKVTINSEIPFGPFLALSTFLVFLFSIDIYSVFSWFTFR